MPQARRISDDDSGDFSRYTGGKLQVFLVRTDSKCFEGVAEQVADCKFRLFQFELASFNFREIQNVVDEMQKAVCRRLDEVEVLPLFGREVGLERQARHPDNAVHRRADLMAHVGQEFTLGAAARFGCLLGHAQGFLRPLARGDVQERHDRADHFSLLAGWIGPVFSGETSAIGAPKNFFV